SAPHVALALHDALPIAKLFILNSPSNPTGAAYTKAELRALGEVLMKHPQVIICTDDMYEHIYWASEPFVSLANVCPELYDRIVRSEEHTSELQSRENPV